MSIRLLGLRDHMDSARTGTGKERVARFQETPTKRK